MRSYQTLYALLVVILSLVAALFLSGGALSLVVREALSPADSGQPPRGEVALVEPGRLAAPARR